MVAPSLSVVSVDEGGVLLAVPDGLEDRVVDVLLDGRRIWSFWVLRDSRVEDGRGLARWPRSLVPYLDGRATVQVTEHITGRVLARSEVQFGSSAEPVRVADERGRPLAGDYLGKVVPTFEGRSAEQTRPLLDALERVLGALHAAGADAFLAYGSLLGAVREGRLVAHDFDADVAYVSRHQHPTDVARESFALERRLVEMGFGVYRYSGGGFRVGAGEDAADERWIDVFSGFLDGTTLHLMGEVAAEFRPDWIWPLGEAELEGRRFAVPAAPERLLEATYGPSWRVPDPAFRYPRSRAVSRRFNGWFRADSANRRSAQEHFAKLGDTLPPRRPSALARLLHEREPADVRVVDAGAGRCRDGLWLARRGRVVSAYDFVMSAGRPAAAAAAQEGRALELRSLNLLRPRSFLPTGAREARKPGPRAVLARQVADCTNAYGRQGLWRFSAMTLSGGGRLFLEHWTGGGRPSFPRQQPLDTDLVLDEIAGHGGRVLEVAEHTSAAQDRPVRTARPEAGPQERTVARVVAEWRR